MKMDFQVCFSYERRHFMFKNKLNSAFLACILVLETLVPSGVFADNANPDLGTREQPTQVEADTSNDELGVRPNTEEHVNSEKESTNSVEKPKIKQEKKQKKKTAHQKDADKDQPTQVEIIEQPEKINNQSGKNSLKEKEYNDLANGDTSDVDWDYLNFGYDMKNNPQKSDKGHEFTSFDPNTPLNARQKSSNTGMGVNNDLSDFNIDISEGKVMEDVNDTEEISAMPSLFDSSNIIQNELDEKKPQDKVKKETIKFNLNPGKENQKLFDLGIPVDTTDKDLVAETLRQVSILSGGRFVEDKDDILLYKGDKLKVFPRTTPLKELLSFFNDSNFEIEEDATRVGGKFTAADFLETTGKLNIKVNGKDLTLTTNPQVVDGIVLMPIRDISVALGAKVEWNQKTRIAKITKGNTVIQLNDKNEIARQNGIGYKLSADPEITPEKKMLATISIIVKNLNATMTWDAHENKINIETHEYATNKAKQENNANAQADKLKEDSNMEGTKFKKPKKDLLNDPQKDGKR